MGFNSGFKGLIRLEATYGIESWTLSKDIAKRLAAFKENFSEVCLGELR